MLKKLIVVFVLFSFTSFGQDVLSLKDALSIALKESFTIKNAGLSLESSKLRLESIKLGLMSTVDLEFDLPNYNRSLTSQFNSTTGTEQFYSTENMIYESRLAINQPLVFSNGMISIIGSLFRRDQVNDITGTNRDFFSNLSFRLRQPLFTFNNLNANLERAERNLLKTTRNYSQSERELIYNVTSGFYALYQSMKSMEISAEKVKQTEISFSTAENKFKAGLIAEVEKLQLEVDLSAAKNELLNARRRFIEQNNSFKLLIGLDLDSDFELIADLSFQPVTVDSVYIVESAIKKRPDLLNIEDDVYLSELSLEEVDAQRSIKAELYANYGINKNAGVFSDVFNQFDDTRSVVLTLSLPVFDWGKSARDVQASVAELDQTKLRLGNLRQSIENDVISSLGRLKAAEARVRVLEKSVGVAQKSYDISLERFRAGKITSFDLSQIQLRLTDAKLNSLNAIIDYLLALADIERKAMVDL